MQELNEKLARWRWPGATSIEFEGGLPTMLIRLPDQPDLIMKPFTDSIDSGFKWLVPELNKRGYYYELFQWNNNQHKAVIIKPTKYWADVVASEIADTPASALAEAIGKVIDNE